MFQLMSRPGWFVFSPQLYYVTLTFYVYYMSHSKKSKF